MTEDQKASTLSKIQRLDHFVLPAFDIERAVTFYENVLGARPVQTFKRPDFSLAFLKLGENHFGLFTQGQATMPHSTNLNSYPS